MNEWKELEKYNLPPDILTRDYEFEYRVFPLDKWRKAINQTVPIVLKYLCKGSSYRYRKPEPEPPTIKELAKEYYENEAGPFYLNEVNEAVRVALFSVDDAIELHIRKAFEAGIKSLTQAVQLK